MRARAEPRSIRSLYALVAAFAIAMWLVLGSGATFRVDDWDLIANRSLGDPGSLVRPYNEQFILVPAVLFRATFDVVGMHSYLPYLAVLLALHGLIAWELGRFVGGLAGPAAAVAAGAVFLFLGSGHENLDSAFQLGAVIATGAGLVGLAQTARGSRLPLAAVALTVAIASHAIGGAFLAACLVVALGRRTAGGAWLGLPLVAGVVWLVAIDLPTFAGRAEPLADAIAAAPVFVLAGPFAAAGALVGLGLAGGAIVVVGLMAFAVRRGGRPHEPWIVAGALTGIGVEYGLVAVSRAAFGVDATTWSRYVYASVPLLIVAIAAWAGPWVETVSAVRRPRLNAALATVVVIAILGNVRAYIGTMSVTRDSSELVRAAVVIASEFPGADRLRSDPVIPGPDELRRLVAAFGSPARDDLAPWVVPAISEHAVLQACTEMTPDVVEACIERVGRALAVKR
jgi:hypothetical protein